jgi:SNF2 family DNA or RNA helicase
LKAEYVTEMFTGKTLDKDRPGVIDRFQKGKTQILLLTTQAGGQGLTLTAASTAVFMDKLWTPAMNTQAQDRLHRIGQTEPVTIIELLAANTVEESIENLLFRKQRIFDNVIETEDSLSAKDLMVQNISMSGPELMRELFSR